MRVLFAAGGTAGHIQPALATAAAIKARFEGVEIAFIGSATGVGQNLIETHGYRIDSIQATPAPRQINSDLFTSPAKIWKSVDQSITLLREREPDVVVGFGGYVAAPVYLAAKRTGLPLALHEANAKAGWANRLGARLTSFVGENYPGSLPHAEVVGMPLNKVLVDLNRSELRAQAREYFGFENDRPTLLVTGGSQGARRLNEVTALALKGLSDVGVDILHICGAANLAQSPPASKGYRPVGFVEEMILAYSATDFVCARAGATTVAEIGVLGLPAFFVPLPIGNGEQRLNAAPLVNAGLAEQTDDAAFGPNQLVGWAAELATNPGRIDEISSQLKGTVIADGAARMACLIHRAVGSRRVA